MSKKNITLRTALGPRIAQPCLGKSTANVSAPSHALFTYINRKAENLEGNLNEAEISVLDCLQGPSVAVARGLLCCHLFQALSDTPDSVTPRFHLLALRGI